jgi:hypothetical protein
VGNDPSLRRWNICARRIISYQDVRQLADEDPAPELLE